MIDQLILLIYLIKERFVLIYKALIHYYHIYILNFKMSLTQSFLVLQSEPSINMDDIQMPLENSGTVTRASSEMPSH